MSTAALQIDVKGLLPLKRQLELLAMPRATRRRLLYRVAKRVTSASKKRASKQVDLKGRPFKTRARKRKGNRKMLTRMARKLKVVRNDSLEAVIGFNSPVLAHIASKQQHGAVEQMSAKKLAAMESGTARDGPATRKQARALREAGYQIKRAKGKGKKKPSLKWITENMKVGQAGAALAYLRAQAGETIKQSWTTTLPARSFLGATAQEITEHIEFIFKQMKQEMNHAVT